MNMYLDTLIDIQQN